MTISGLGSGIGVTLKHTVISPSTTTFTTIVQILAIGVQGQRCSEINISSAGSTNQYEEFLPGLLNAGRINLVIRYGSSLGVSADDTYDELQTLFDTREIGTFEIMLPGTATSSWKCSAFITQLGIAVHYRNGVQMTMQIKCTGKPTFTEAA